VHCGHVDEAIMAMATGWRYAKGSCGVQDQTRAERWLRAATHFGHTTRTRVVEAFEPSMVSEYQRPAARPVVQ
jgi:hypothetical protein